MLRSNTIINNFITIEKRPGSTVGWEGVQP